MRTGRWEPEHDLAASLSHVETCRVHNDYTIQVQGRFHQIEREAICAGLRGVAVRVELRLRGSVQVRFRERYMAVHVVPARPQPPVRRAARAARRPVFRKVEDLRTDDSSGLPFQVWRAMRDETTCFRPAGPMTHHPEIGPFGAKLALNAQTLMLSADAALPVPAFWTLPIQRKARVGDSIQNG